MQSNVDKNSDPSLQWFLKKWLISILISALGGTIVVICSQWLVAGVLTCTLLYAMLMVPVEYRLYLKMAQAYENS
jgi:hypothetical protein